MRWRSTWVLALIFAALLFYLLRWEKDKPSDAEREAAALEVMSLDQSRISWFRIETERDTVEARRDDDGEWNLLVPIEDRADDARVHSLLEYFSPLRAVRIVEGSRSQQIKYQLDRPSIIATIEPFTGGASKRRTLLVGRRNPAFNTYYAVVDHDTSYVCLIEQEFVEGNLLRPAMWYRSRRVANFKSEDAERVVLIVPDGRFIIERDADRTWSLVEPASFQADQAVVNGLVSRLRTQLIAEFVLEFADDPAKFQLEPPDVLIGIFLEDGSSHSLLVGAPAGEGDFYYAKRSTGPAIFTISASARIEYLKTLFALRERRILDYETSQVSEVEIARGDSLFAAVRDSAGTWMMAMPDGGRRELIAYPLESAFRNLSVLRAQEFIDDPDALARLGFDEPELRVTVTLGDGTTQVVVVTGEGDRTFARRVGATHAGRVRASDLELIGGLVHHPPLVRSEGDALSN